MNFEDYIFKSRNRNTYTQKNFSATIIINKLRDIVTLQELFNHSSSSIILKYIGINQDILDSAYENFSL